jgi:hypothetical protein
MYTLYITSVELDARLATVPQPVFHYNILLASLAIDSSQLPSSPKTQTPQSSNNSPETNHNFSDSPNSEDRTHGYHSTPRYMTSGRTVEETVLLALVV